MGFTSGLSFGAEDFDLNTLDPLNSHWQGRPPITRHSEIVTIFYKYCDKERARELHGAELLQNHYKDKDNWISIN